MGNRVKGRTKKKSLKAPISSSMSTQRKLSRMGKKRKKNLAGLDATFIKRSSVLKKLQISLKDFRRLCILKGVYPREPHSGSSKKRDQICYHIKDVKSLSHEPLLVKFREFKSFMKKVRRAAGRNEKTEALRKDALIPRYTLHHLIKERYPRFIDALGDLDDALTLIYLFAALPSEGKIKASVTHKAKTLAASWGAYCAMTCSITKSFISVKGVYLEAIIQNLTIRWVVPHSFAQNIPNEVDFRVMLTFYEFYENLLGFVLFKLYHNVGIRYPLQVHYPNINSGESALSAYLRVLQEIVNHSKDGLACSAISETVEKKYKECSNNTTVVSNKSCDNKKTNTSLLPVNFLQKVKADNITEDEDKISDSPEDAVGLINNESTKIIGAPLLSDISSFLDGEAMKRKCLFSNLIFYFSREIPTGYLELVSIAYGAKVGWDGEGSIVKQNNPSITHVITDRPMVDSQYKNDSQRREYVQPQWIIDCANFRFLLPCSRYALGVQLPPHLSPWVDYENGMYKPAYALEVEQMMEGENINIDRENSENTHEKKICKISDNDDLNEDSEDKNEKKVERQNIKIQHEVKELAKSMMSKKATRLYHRMQYGLAEKREKEHYLHRKRKVLDSTKGHK